MKTWAVEEWDGGWGGWRKVRQSWESDDPATFRTKRDAEAVAAQRRRERPHARARVVES
jgi:hypothetical protein